MSILGRAMARFTHIREWARIIFKGMRDKSRAPLANHARALEEILIANREITERDSLKFHFVSDVRGIPVTRPRLNFDTETNSIL